MLVLPLSLSLSLSLSLLVLPPLLLLLLLPPPSCRPRLAAPRRASLHLTSPLLTFACPSCLRPITSLPARFCRRRFRIHPAAHATLPPRHLPVQPLSSPLPLRSSTASRSPSTRAPVLLCECRPPSDTTTTPDDAHPTCAAPLVSRARLDSRFFPLSPFLSLSLPPSSPPSPWHRNLS